MLQLLEFNSSYRNFNQKHTNTSSIQVLHVQDYSSYTILINQWALDGILKNIAEGTEYDSEMESVKHMTVCIHFSVILILAKMVPML